MILSGGLKRIMEMVREMRIRNLVCTSCLCGPEVKPSPSLMDFHSGPHSGRQTEELGDGDQITSLSRATLCCFHGSGYLADIESTECDTQSRPKSLHGLMQVKPRSQICGGSALHGCSAAGLPTELLVFASFKATFVEKNAGCAPQMRLDHHAPLSNLPPCR